MENTTDQRALQPEVAEKYDVQKVAIGRHHFNGFGVIDLTTLTLAQADDLAARGFYWLKVKDTAAPANGNKNKVVIPPVTN
jgi:hypothetical protein